MAQLEPGPLDGALHGLAKHPQAIDQAFLANWNNKQARGYRAADDNFSYGSVYRSQSLDRPDPARDPRRGEDVASPS